MSNKLEEFESYKQMQVNRDVAALLRCIKQVSHQIEDTMYIYDAIDDLQRQFYNYRQSPNDDNAVHLAKFKDLIDVLDHAGLDMFADPCLLEYEKKLDITAGLSPASDQEYKKRVKSKKTAVCFLRRSNQRTYKPLLNSLRYQFLMDIDAYPTTLEGAYRLIQNHSSGKHQTITQQQPRQNESSVTGMQCVQRL